jgi:hypothetical protein
MFNISDTLAHFIHDKLTLHIKFKNGVKTVTVTLKKVPLKYFDELFAWMSACSTATSMGEVKLDILYYTVGIYGLFPKEVDKLNLKVKFSFDYYEEGK